MKKQNFAKKSLSAILALAMLVGILAMLPITTSAASDAGTADNPIVIASTSDWNALATTLASASNTGGVSYVVLTADLDFEGSTVTPLALGSLSVHIEGNDHTVKNYKATVGLIEALGDNSTVQNLHVIGATVSGSATYVGGLVGSAKDGLVMTNVTTDSTTTVTNSSTSSDAGTGGLVGAFVDGSSNFDFVLRHCINRASVSGKSNVGGLVGDMNNEFCHLTLQACENYGAVTNAKIAGGLFGSISLALNVTLKECLNNATVSGSTAAGGLIGQNKGRVGTSTYLKESGVTDTQLDYCVNKGTVNGTTYAGGLIGYSIGGIFYSIDSYCGNEGSITSTASNGYTGGILAYHNHSYNNTTVPTRHWFGPCYNTGTIAASSGYTGGILGYFAASTGTGVTVSECYDAATHSISNPSSGKHGLLAGEITGTDTSLGANGNANKILYFTRSHGVTSGSISKLFGGSTKVNLMESCNNGNGVASLESNITTNWGGTDAVKFATRLAEWQRNAQMKTPRGVGSKDDPYRIADERNLFWLASSISSFDTEVNVVLTNDIDYGGHSISMNFSSKKLFFDGNGYTISNYTSTQGLFSVLYSGSTIQNLNVANATIASGSSHAGAIVGYALYGGLAMINCSTASNVSVSGSTSAGGLIGSLEEAGDANIFINCTNNATVNAQNGAGGILGQSWAQNTTIEFFNCVNNGTVTNDGTNGTAGIMGYVFLGGSVSFYNCVNTGTIGKAGNSSPAAGILGVTCADARNTLLVVTMHGCKNVGTVTSTTQAAGMLGYGRLSGVSKTWNLKACTNTGTLNGATVHNVIAATQGSLTVNQSEVTLPTLDISKTSAKLSVRIKLTDDFGLMAITEVATGSKTVTDYQEVGFYFAEVDGRFLPSDLFRDENRRRGGAYNGHTELFCAAYTDLRASDLDRTIAFAAYVMDAEGNIAVSDIRTIEVKPVVEDLVDGKFGNVPVTEKVEEMALYEAMLNYANAYASYQSVDLKIGSFNIFQNAYDKTDAFNDYFLATKNTAAANIKKYAATMDALDLDVMGMNEVDIYRGDSSSYGGFNTPWEVAKEMERLNPGTDYYWAFAAALDSSSGLRTCYNPYTNKTDPADYPDGRWYSGDGGDARTADTAGYGEAIVSKYPIVSYSYQYIVPADYANGTATYSKYTADYQYDSSTEYERRVILVVQLDVDGEIVTVMVTHLDHTGNAIALQASVGAITQLAEKYKNSPVFLMGDLNVTKGSTTINSLDQILNRSGNDNITKTHLNGNKIDYIYYNDLVDLKSYRVDSRNGASDHSLVHISVRITKKAFR